MFETTRRALLRSAGGVMGLPPVVRRAFAAGETHLQGDLVRTGPASADGRRVTFTAEIDPSVREGRWEAVGFWYADYNEFWYPTRVKRLGEFAGTRVSITDTVPYSDHPFPYFAYLTEDADAAREVTTFHTNNPFPTPRGEIRSVTVPSTADTITVETVDVFPGETSATVRGRIADYGTALEIYAGAHYGRKDPVVGPLSTVVEKSPGDDPRFQVEFRGLEPDTEYTVRAVAAVPAGPIVDTAFGNDVTFTTGTGGGDGGSHTLSVESDGTGFVAAYDALLSGDVSPGGDAEGNELKRQDENGTFVRGHVGPDRGRDDFAYTGGIEALVLAGPAAVAVDGYEINPDVYPAPSSSVTAADLATGGGRNTLELRSTGGGVAAYELAVDGSLRGESDAEESIEDGYRVTGRLGPERGRDTYRFDGEIYEFRLAGPAEVRLNGRRIDPATAEPHTVEIRSRGGGVAVYDFGVSGELRPGTDDEATEVDGRRARGHVGPERGIDAFVYTGEIETFGLVGPADVQVDGGTVNPERYPLSPGALTEADFEPIDGENRLRIAGTGGGIAAYEFAVTGELRPGEDAASERIDGSSVFGRVGPERGVDTFAFTGEVARFRLVGPARVSLNGAQVSNEI